MSTVGQHIAACLDCGFYYITNYDDNVINCGTHTQTHAQAHIFVDMYGVRSGLQENDVREKL